MENESLKSRVTVLGATGKVGSQVIRYLSEREIQSTAVTRNLQKANKLPYVEWMEADMNDSTQLARIFNGSTKLFLNSGVNKEMVTTQNAIIDAAKEKGVTHVVKLSTPAARQPSKDAVGEWHWQIEEHLKSSGMDWNILQPQSFMQNWLGDVARTARSERKIYSTSGNGKRAYTDARDIGKVAVHLFEEPRTWLNQILPLSGGELVSFYDLATAISEATGEEITYVDQTSEEARTRMRLAGIPEFLIEVALVTEANQKAGNVTQFFNDNVETITGVRPFTLREFAREYAAAFK